MKKYLLIIIVFFSLFSITLTACTKDIYEEYYLKNVIISDMEHQEEIYSCMEFEEKLSDIINNLGKHLTIKNSNEILFTGENTKDLDGEMEMYDAVVMTYITIRNSDFYYLYDNIEIIQGKLYIESHYELIDDKYVRFFFEFVKE